MEAHTAEEAAQLTTSQVAALTTTQTASIPRPVETVIKEEFINAVQLLFPGMGLLTQVVNLAKAQGFNITVSVLFATDGRVLVSEPQIARPPAPAPTEEPLKEKSEEAKPEEAAVSER